MTEAAILEISPAEQAALVELERALTSAVCNVLQGSRLSALQVLCLAAMATGGVYRDIAAAHREGACPCGWMPSPAADIELLQAALALATRPRRTGLENLPVAGRA